MQPDKPIILAIDDDAIILNTVVSILKANFSVRPFTSGEAALNYLKTNPADLILLDQWMPGMTGLEILQRLRSSPETSQIPTIFLTGALDNESEALALETGAVDYIHKPVKPQTLLIRVRFQLELQRHRKHLEALVEEKTRSLNAAYNKLKMRENITLDLLARTADMRDHYTGGHIERTTAFVRIIVEYMLANPKPGYTLSLPEADDIVRSSKLHDLGKVATPDSVLLKPGRLTEEEFALVKQHPIYGEKMLRDFIQLQEEEDSFLNTARSIAYGHHERWDGSGYPQGLKGEEIPLAARIVAIADVYDALTSERPYKSILCHDESMRIIRENRGSHFDPYITDIFLKHAAEVAKVSRHPYPGRS